MKPLIIRSYILLPHPAVAFICFFAMVWPVLFAAPVSRDWQRFPAIAQTDSNKDIYVVGDVHGDYERLVGALRGAHVIGPKSSGPKHSDWIANDAIVVFMGDLIDKGQHGLDVISFVQALQATAQTHGGQVFSLMGNHEAEFLANPAEKKVKDFALELTTAKKVPSDVAFCRGDVGTFLCSEPIGLRIRTWFFSHAGNTHGDSIAKLVERLQNGIDTKGFGSNELIGDDSILEARLGEKGPDGEPWFEADTEHDAKFTLTKYATALGAKHLVQAHQPGNVTFADGIRRKKGEMFQRFGLIYLVDTGMSRGVGDSDGAVLHIKPEPNEEAIVICPDGTKTTIWDSRATPAIGSARACGR